METEGGFRRSQETLLKRTAAIGQEFKRNFEQRGIHRTPEQIAALAAQEMNHQLARGRLEREKPNLQPRNTK